MDCGGALMKYILFFFNFIFFVCGAAILGVGIWVKIDPAVAEHINLTVDSGTYDAAIYLLIVVGAFILLVGFLGCCGACKESACMLGLFAALMIFIVLLQIAAAVLAVVFRSKVESQLREHLANEMHDKVQNGGNDPTTKGVELMQMEFKCCGANDWKDYGENSKIYNTTTPDHKLVPKSCCVNAKEGNAEITLSKNDWDACSNESAKATPDTNILKTTGCYESLLDWVKNHAVIVIGVGFGLAVIEILGVVFACCVRSKISEQAKY